MAENSAEPGLDLRWSMFGAVDTENQINNTGDFDPRLSVLRLPRHGGRAAPLSPRAMTSARRRQR
jgi:hypothetical protein